MKAILGISAYYHDSAAALLIDGQVASAAQEERFSRRKHDSRFPHNAIRYCLDQAGVSISQLEAVSYYEKPLLTFERLLETYIGAAPRGGRSFVAAMQTWLHEKLFLKQIMKNNLQDIAGQGATIPPLLFSEHHLSHASAAFFPSPYKSSAVLCMDGVGEWATTSAWMGEADQLNPLWEISFPHSLGLLYSAFTYYTGFKVNSGEYKLMGLAPYGVFALLGSLFADMGLSAIADLAKYFFTLLAVLLFHGLVVYSLILKVLARRSPVMLLNKMRSVWAFAFSTASSGATLPITLRTVEKRLGVNNIPGIEEVSYLTSTTALEIAELPRRDPVAEDTNHLLWRECVRL